MDNRYLFRAWDKKRKRMYEVVDLHKDPFQGFWATVKGFDIIEQKDIHIQIQPKDCILMQCTGLIAAKSYRGESEADRLIWEGDVIKTHYANAPKADFVETVVFKNGKFMAECKIGDTGKSWALLADGVPHLSQDKSVYMESCEIIGTIHDRTEGEE